ncbi:MAG TPA: methyltransferase [Caulobacteraceae bacterium]|nr:methyltransferase [Caulobacteraceae bacterium]
MAKERLTNDAVLGGRIRLRQPARGYRAGLDAALLAAACAGLKGRVLEAGCGVGAAMLAAARRAPGARFTGVEKDPALTELARQNIAANGLGDRVEAITGDIAAPFSSLCLASFDAAIANPPFFDDPSRLRGPDPAKRAAWLTAEGLAAWTGFLLKSVRERGIIILIHRAERLADLLAALTPKAGSFQIRPAHPWPDAPASRVIVRAVKTGGAPLRLLPPLFLHERDGAKHTPETEAILRGEAALEWL